MKKLIQKLLTGRKEFILRTRFSDSKNVRSGQIPTPFLISKFFIFSILETIGKNVHKNIIF